VAYLGAYLERAKRLPSLKQFLRDVDPRPRAPSAEEVRASNRGLATLCEMLVYTGDMVAGEHPDRAGRDERAAPAGALED
jgi:hypothetical protein